MTPSTELPRDFCARIGPLQLGVVLVYIYILIVYSVDIIITLQNSPVHKSEDLMLDIKMSQS